MWKVCPSIAPLVCFLVGCAAPAPQHGAEDRTVEVTGDVAFLTLGPGDHLRVDVLGHPELSSTLDGVHVDPQGSIFLPLVGRLSVSGRTLEEVNTVLGVEYGRFLREPNVTAIVLEYGSKHFHVLGNIALPGQKTMDRPLNALEALSQGGAFTRGADRASVHLLRPRGETIEVHQFNAATPGPAGLVAIRPGDIVFVGQKGTQNFQEAVLPILAGLGLSTILSYEALSD